MNSVKQGFVEQGFVTIELAMMHDGSAWVLLTAKGPIAPIAIGVPLEGLADLIAHLQKIQADAPVDVEVMRAGLALGPAVGGVQ